MARVRRYYCAGMLEQRLGSQRAERGVINTPQTEVTVMRALSLHEAPTDLLTDTQAPTHTTWETVSWCTKNSTAATAERRRAEKLHRCPLAGLVDREFDERCVRRRALRQTALAQHLRQSTAHVAAWVAWVLARQAGPARAAERIEVICCDPVSTIAHAATGGAHGTRRPSRCPSTGARTQRS